MVTQEQKDEILSRASKIASIGGGLLSNASLLKKAAEGLDVDDAPTEPDPEPEPTEPDPEPTEPDPEPTDPDPEPDPDQPIPIDGEYGIPLGTQLTVVTGGLQLGTGETRDGLDIRGPFRSTASREPVPVLTRSKIDGTGRDDAVYYGGYTLDQCTIDAGSDGLKMNSKAKLLRSLVMGLDLKPGDHGDCVQITNGSDVEIGYSKLVATPGANACIMIGSDQGPISDVYVHDTVLQIDPGGHAQGYALYTGDSGCTNMRYERITFDCNEDRALYPGARPRSGYLRDCRYRNGRPVPDETWG